MLSTSALTSSDSDIHMPPQQLPSKYWRERTSPRTGCAYTVGFAENLDAAFLHLVWDILKYGSILGLNNRNSFGLSRQKSHEEDLKSVKANAK